MKPAARLIRCQVSSQLTASWRYHTTFDAKCYSIQHLWRKSFSGDTIHHLSSSKGVGGKAILTKKRAAPSRNVRSGSGGCENGMRHPHGRWLQTSLVCYLVLQDCYSWASKSGNLAHFGNTKSWTQTPSDTPHKPGIISFAKAVC